MYYYDEQKSLCKICDALRNLGWNIFGYHEDQSDPMTDYFCPESWDGIAEKNGYVFCANVNDWTVKRYSGKEVFTSVEEVYKGIDNSKIKQLQALANDQAATDGEKQAALAAIERIQNRVKKDHEAAEAKKEFLYKIPEFQANPPRCNWHVEKNGKIVAKGIGAFQFYNLAYNGDCMRSIDKIMKDPRLVINAVTKNNFLFSFRAREKNQYFLFSHLEYGKDALLKEYLRERNANPGVEYIKPQNYFRDPLHMKDPEFSWATTQRVFFDNWLLFQEKV